MPAVKARPGRPTTDGRKSLLKRNGASDDPDEDDWVVTYNQNANTGTPAESGDDRRRHSSDASAARSIKSRIEDLELDDTGFVDLPPISRTRINRRVFILIIVGVALGVAAVVSVVVFYFRSNDVPNNYIIVIDAGSSHTKLNVFHYRGDKINGTGKIEQLKFLECNGTLMQFNKNPDILRSKWKSCLIVAKEAIPAERWYKTEVYVGATGGLRQLRKSDPDGTEALLEDVRLFLNETYDLPYEQFHVLILSGEEEGALAWATVNFVTKHLLPDNITLLDHRRLHETYGSMDLGGSSTQIAFATSSHTVPTNFELTFFGVQYNLYSKSFMCRGKGEALRILKAQLVIENAKSANQNSTIILACFPSGSSTTELAKDLFNNPCTSVLPDKPVVASRKNYTFYGTGNLTECRRLVNEIFKDPKCPFHDEGCSFGKNLRVNVTGPFLGFAGLVFVTEFLNLTNNANSVTVDLEEFRDAYRRHCLTPWSQLETIPNNYTKGYCFDGIYIDTLLTEVYGFDHATFQRIEFRKDVNGVSTGWAVGLALNSTNAVVPEVEVQVISKAFFLVFLVIFAVFLILAVSFLCRGVRRSCRDSSI